MADDFCFAMLFKKKNCIGHVILLLYRNQNLFELMLHL